MRGLIAVCTILVLACPALAAADFVVVKVLRVSIKSSRSVQASTVAEAERGHRLEVVKKEGSWYMVRLPDRRTGWVFEYSVEPAGESSEEQDLFGKLERSSRIQVSEATSASSIRGLSRPARVYADHRGLNEVYVRAVEEMDAYSVAQEEVDRFLMAGGVGGK